MLRVNKELLNAMGAGSMCVSKWTTHNNSKTLSPLPLRHPSHVNGQCLVACTHVGKVFSIFADVSAHFNRQRITLISKTINIKGV